MKDFLIWVIASIGAVFGMHSQSATTTMSAPVPIVQTQSNTSDTLSIIDPKDITDFATCMSYAKNVPTNFDIVFGHGSDIQEVTNIEADFLKAYPQSKLKISTEQDLMDEAVAYNGGSIKTASALADYKKQITPQLTSKISVSIPLQYLGTKKSFNDLMSATLSKYPQAKFQQYSGSSPETFLADSSVSVGESQYLYQQQCIYKYKTLNASSTTILSSQMTPTLLQAQAIGRNARIQADVAQLRVMAELVYQNNNSYATFCQNGLVNTSAYKDLLALVQDIVSTQGVSDQAHAGLTCVSNQSKYVLGVTYTSQTAKPGVTSFCIDSNGNDGDNNKFTLNSSTISCQSIH